MLSMHLNGANYYYFLTTMSVSKGDNIQGYLVVCKNDLTNINSNALIPIQEAFLFFGAQYFSSLASNCISSLSGRLPRINHSACTHM